MMGTMSSVEHGSVGSAAPVAVAADLTEHVEVVHEQWPTLTEDGPDWLAVFPGLGSVRVHDDGSYDISVEPVPASTRVSATGVAPTITHSLWDGAPEIKGLQPRNETETMRHEALRFGWAEPLAWRRRGYRLLHGGTVLDPDSGKAVAVLGPPHDTAIVVLELARRGWHLISDQFAPVIWRDESLEAAPAAAPLVVSRSRAVKAGLPGVPVRANTNTVRLDVPRAQSPAAIAATVHVSMHKEGDEEPFVVLQGRERLTASAGLLMPETLLSLMPLVSSGDADRTLGDEAAAKGGTAVTPQQAFAEHMKAMAIPGARLYLDSGDVAGSVESVVSWWEEGPGAQ